MNMNTQNIKKLIRIFSISYLILSLGMDTEFLNKVVRIGKRIYKKYFR